MFNIIIRYLFTDDLDIQDEVILNMALSISTALACVVAEISKVTLMWP